MLIKKGSGSTIILIAADEKSRLDVLFDYLKGFGFRVLVVDDGEQVMKIAKDIVPDIILLDVVLPRMDGFDTCRHLKSKEETKNIPVIFITALDNIMDKVRGFSLGAVDYITKPIQIEEVVARLKTHLTMQNLQHSLEEQNNRLQEEITEREKLIKELDAFAHTVAHDLKNPLGVTVSYSQLLSNFNEKLSKDELKEYADIILWNGRKMANIIDELLLLSSVRKENVEMELIDAPEIIKEVRNRLAYMIKEHKAEFVLQDEWPSAWGYAPWIEEVYTNYVSNAIKYGGRPPLVEFGASVQEDGMVKFWVKDNGKGLTEEQRAQLFIPFTRLNQVRIEGHGLGLSIVYRIIEKLQGRVSVESEGVGKGSLFSFSLPKRRTTFV